MYACIHGIGGGFFEGVRGHENRPLTFSDPPPPMPPRAASVTVWCRTERWFVVDGQDVNAEGINAY
jgi:hypothetical protein